MVVKSKKEVKFTRMAKLSLQSQCCRDKEEEEQYHIILTLSVSKQ